jgi:hypothetical protein
MLACFFVEILLWAIDKSYDPLEMDEYAYFTIARSTFWQLIYF